MGQENRPENEFCGYVYAPDGTRHDLLDQWGDVVVVGKVSNMIERGYHWVAHYHMNLLAGATGYIVFDIGDEIIHARNRRVKAIDRGNSPIELEISTLRGATIDVYGNDISHIVANSNFNMDTSMFDFKVYDETTDIIESGSKAAFSDILISDKKSAVGEYIQDEYVLKRIPL